MLNLIFNKYKSKRNMGFTRWVFFFFFVTFAWIESRCLKNNCIQDCTQTPHLKSFSNQEGLFSMVDVKLSLQRRTLFFSFNFVLPVLIISILSIAGFVLPPECGEKVGLRKFIKLKQTISDSFFLIELFSKEITNLLGLIFFLNYISQIIPPSSLAVSKICKYFINDCWWF